MSVPKTPAMPLYGKDAYDDEAFSRLSFAEQGLYWYLAWWQWQEGSIPADLELILDKLPRKKEGEAIDAWQAVAPFFPICDDEPARRRHISVERRRLKLMDKRARQQFGAGLTNQKRWGDRENEKRTETARHGANDGREVPAVRVAPENAVATGSGVPGIDLVQRVFSVLLPAAQVPDDFTVTRWLRDLNSDPWQIAAAACELSGSVTGKRSIAYVNKAMANKFAEGYRADDAKGYVEYMISPERMKKLAN